MEEWSPFPVLSGILLDAVLASAVPKLHKLPYCWEGIWKLFGKLNFFILNTYADFSAEFSELCPALTGLLWMSAAWALCVGGMEWSHPAVAVPPLWRSPRVPGAAQCGPLPWHYWEHAGCENKLCRQLEPRQDHPRVFVE